MAYLLKEGWNGEGGCNLVAPMEFWKASVIERQEKANGCGPQGWKIDVIPDTIWFLSIYWACVIHDWMYGLGTTLEDKKQSDRVFLNNMNRLTQAGSKIKILRRLRYNRANIYYVFVKYTGGPAFWKGKNKELKEA